MGKDGHAGGQMRHEERPLPTLLSQAFAAFTIEVDNDFEATMPHCTTLTLKAGRAINRP